MKGLNALFKAGPLGAIATTLPLAVLITGSALVKGSWANEIPDAEPSAPVIAANWNAPRCDQWTVPIGGGFGRVFAVGSQPPQHLSPALLECRATHQWS